MESLENNISIDLDVEFFTYVRKLNYQKQEIRQFSNLDKSDENWIRSIGIKFGKLCESVNLNNTGLTKESLVEVTCISSIWFFKVYKWSQIISNKNLNDHYNANMNHHYEDLVIEDEIKLSKELYRRKLNWISILGEELGRMCFNKSGNKLGLSISVELISNIIRISSICLSWYKSIEESEMEEINKGRSERGHKVECYRFI